MHGNLLGQFLRLVLVTISTDICDTDAKNPVHACDKYVYWYGDCADDHYKYSGCPSRDQLILDRAALKLAGQTLRNCRANGMKTHSTPEHAIDLTGDD
eukprot:SAG11_NODE_5238_length_1620_cov_2.095989_1_plen_98_part_00